MKKSVILIIAIVYLASVIIVGLMGLNMKVYNQVEYVTEIKYVPQGTLDEVKSTESVLSYKKTDKGGYTNEKVYLTQEEKAKYNCDAAVSERLTVRSVFEIKFSVLPLTATKKDLSYSCDEKDVYKVDGEKITDHSFKAEEGHVEEGYIILTKNADGHAMITVKQTEKFTGPKTFIIKVKALDGSNKEFNFKLTVVSQ